MTETTPVIWPAAWLRALLIIAAGAFALWPVLDSPWYGDDDLYILNNPLMSDPFRLREAWFGPGTFIEYYPLSETVQWLQWQAWGDQPIKYHATNLALHLASALLVWWLLAKFRLRFAWVGGLIFAVHPLFVDTIAAANELKNTLSLPPFLLAMGFYLDFEKSGKPIYYRFAVALFLVAMLCKITMAFFPGVILLYAWWKRGRITMDDMGRAVPFLGISLVLMGLTLHAGDIYAATIHYESPAPIHLGGLFNRLALAGLSLAFYIGRAFFPLDPLPLYPLWKIDPLTPWLFLPLLLVAAIVALCWSRRSSWGRPILFALGFFVLGLAPFLGLNQTSYMAMTWTSDHFLYIPILAPIALAMAGLDLWAQRVSARVQPLIMAGVGVMAGLLVFQTWSYSRLFPEPEKLWAYDEQFNPDSWFPPFRIGALAYGRNQMPEAAAYLHRSTQLNPDFWSAQFYAGLSLCNTGHFDEGIEALRQSIRLRPYDFSAHFYLGMAMLHVNNLDEAITEFKAALRARSDSVEVEGALSSTLLKAGRYDEALGHVEHALLVAPNNEALEQLYTTILQAQKAAAAHPNAKPPAAKQG
jgi:hypothetical protein